MPSSAVSSAIDVAIWFSEQARKDDDYMQPQKLQRLLYLALGSFAAINFGRKLMPATFVADETGPIEPSVFHLFESGPPKLPLRQISPEVENFLYEIWRRYSHHSTDYINQQIQFHDIYSKALKRGLHEEIPFHEMVTFFTGQDEARKKKRERIKTKDGRTLEKWLPSGVAKAKPTNK